MNYAKTFTVCCAVILIFSWSSLCAQDSGDGWKDAGNIVSLKNVDDSVGIGTSTPSAKLEVIDGSGTIGKLATEEHGVYGAHSSGNYGYLGDRNRGVYGRSYNNNIGSLGSANFGVTGYHAGTGNSGRIGSLLSGVFGSNVNGNFGRLGTKDAGVLGQAETGWAGKFEGDVYTSGELQIGGTGQTMSKLFIENKSDILANGALIHMSGQGKYIKTGLTVSCTMGESMNKGIEVFVGNYHASGDQYGVRAASIAGGQKSAYGSYNIGLAFGEGDAYGVLGSAGAFSATGNIYAVYGTTTGHTSGQSYAGYFDGKMVATGKVGIGTDNLIEELTVAGDICYSGSSFSCSDARYKQNVENITGALDRVTRMQGVWFRWRGLDYPKHKFDDTPQIGFIGQEMIEILPEVVSQGTDDHYNIDYSKLAPILVEAIKELKAENDELRKRVENLESQ